MDGLIPVINKLQDVLNAVGSDGIDLPQIVVVGSQSSGKSSVLENLVGRDFLPRGSGIVTRRPLVLQLYNIPPSSFDDHSDSKVDSGSSSIASGEWGEFLHLPKQTFRDFSQIRDEIQKETDRLAGKNKAISSTPITLKIYSPYVLNLTLVDLPGITRVPVGDQPSNIEEQIRDMVLTYISKPSAIILAVTAANTDLANSDALQLAKRVDPTGDRTIGVLTKLDLMDKGTNALEVLQGKLVPLKMGYIAVMNRSQQDIILNKPIREALKAEAEFFASHNLYKQLHGQCGTTFLASTLNQTLMAHIKAKLPDLKAKVQKNLDEATRELKSFGDAPQGQYRAKLILDLITKFSRGYHDIIAGKGEKDDSHYAHTTELSGGARINYVFNDIFIPELMRLDPLDGLTAREICYAIRNATGPRNALFIPEAAFELLVKRQISRLEGPALQCVDNVFNELLRIVAQLEDNDLARFEKMREEVMNVAHTLLQNCRIPCKQMIADLLAIENAYINTAHPDFQSSTTALHASNAEQLQTSAVKDVSQQQRKGSSPASPVAQSTSSSRGGNKETSLASVMAKSSFGSGPLSEREKQEVAWVQSLLVSYFGIVRKNIQDTVPKAIMHLLVNHSAKMMADELILKLLNEGNHEELLMESQDCTARRKACEMNVEILKKAKEILSSVRDAVV